eukprot:scaffold6495_cov109-Skeletonema_dohrnii-CCMP3373.AAC.3
MSPNTKIDSSSPPTNGHQISSSAPCSTATGLISPFAHATTITKKGAYHQPSNPNNNNIHTHQNQTESDFSLPLSTPQIDSYQISHLTQARHRIKQSIIAQSPLLSSNDKEYIFPRFDRRELVLGDVLGSGGFGTVLEIQGIRLLTADEDHDDANNNTKKKQQQSSSRRPSRIKCRSFDDSHLKQPTTTTTTKHHHNVHRKSPVANITRGIRTKALSWNVKKAHEVIPDVGHFFHHHRGSGSGSGGGSGAIGEEKECVDTTAQEINEYQDGIPSAATWNGSELQQQEQAAANEEEQSQQPRQQQRQQTPPKRQISRNFSLKAWRESDPGDEGKDAISLEEMERYKVEYSNSRHGANAGGTSSSLSANIGEEEDGKVKAEGRYEDEGCDLQHQTDCLVDEVVCPGTNLSTVLEKSEERPSGSSQFSIYDTVDHTEHDDTNNDSQQQSQQQRRIVFFEPTTSHYQGIIQQDKQYISENTTTPTGESRYVIKIIQPDIVQTDFKKFLQAAMDMATETKFLSVLSHPHILKMRAVGQGDFFSPDYFLVLDRLYDTLLDRIEGSWRVMADHLEHDFLVWSRASKVKSLWAERMGVMRDVAGALAKGVVKLFDFGLAKEVRKEDASPNGTYKLTPDTGSLRYMAPEVGNKWPYNFLADAYSFGIMLWEVTSLNRPFAMYTPNEIRDMVMKWGERPKVKDVWPERLKQLMTSAWDSSFRKRPTMEAFRDALEEEVTEALHNITFYKNYSVAFPSVKVNRASHHRDNIVYD